MQSECTPRRDGCYRAVPRGVHSHCGLPSDRRAECWVPGSVEALDDLPSFRRDRVNGIGTVRLRRVRSTRSHREASDGRASRYPSRLEYSLPGIVRADTRKQSSERRSKPGYSSGTTRSGATTNLSLPDIYESPEAAKARGPSTRDMQEPRVSGRTEQN